MLEEERRSGLALRGVNAVPQTQERNASIFAFSPFARNASPFARFTFCSCESMFFTVILGSSVQ